MGAVPLYLQQLHTSYHYGKAAECETVVFPLSPFCLQQKATITSASTTSTPRGARGTTSPQQASSPTSELAAQLQDLVFSGQQDHERQLTSPPPRQPTTHGNHTRVLRSKRQVSRVKANENSPVVLEVKRDLSKCESNSCSLASGSVGSGSQAVATEEGEKVVAGAGTELTLHESSAVDRHTSSKEGEGVLLCMLGGRRQAQFGSSLACMP